MTEIPEHLLARSKAAKARLSGEGGDDETPAADSGAASTAPVPAAAAAPVPAADAAPAEPPPPEPDAPYVAAGKSRKKVPVWIVPVLLFLPFWAMMYLGMTEPPPEEEGGLLAFGGEEYAIAGCAGCHGGGGGGGTGRQLNDGEVLLTFPSQAAGSEFDGLAHHIAWTVNGTSGTETPTYGDPDREGGVRETGSFGNMAGNPSLGIEELVSVVYYERVTHGLLEDEAAETELEVLEAMIASAEESGLEWAAQTPDEISELLDEARAEVGGEGEAAAE